MQRAISKGAAPPGDAIPLPPIPRAAILRLRLLCSLPSESAHPVNACKNLHFLIASTGKIRYNESTNGSQNWNLTKECSLCLNYLKRLFGLSAKISPHVPASQKHMLQLLNIVNQMGIPIISSAIMKLKLRESYMKYAASVLLFTVDDMSLSVGRNNKPLSYKFQYVEQIKTAPVVGAVSACQKTTVIANQPAGWCGDPPKS